MLRPSYFFRVYTQHLTVKNISQVKSLHPAKTISKTNYIIIIITFPTHIACSVSEQRAALIGRTAGNQETKQEDYPKAHAAAAAYGNCKNSPSPNRCNSRLATCGAPRKKKWHFSTMTRKWARPRHAFTPRTVCLLLAKGPEPTELVRKPLWLLWSAHSLAQNKWKALHIPHL